MISPAVYLHHLPQLFSQLGIDPTPLESQPYHIAVSCLTLLIPGALAATLHASGALLAWYTGDGEGYTDSGTAIDGTLLANAKSGLKAMAADIGIPATSARDSRPVNAGISGALRVLQDSIPAEKAGKAVKPTDVAVSYAARRDRPPLPPFLDLAYGYMPLVWGATLAHYLPMLLTEVGRFLPVRSKYHIDCSARLGEDMSSGIEVNSEKALSAIISYRAHFSHQQQINPGVLNLVLQHSNRPNPDLRSEHAYQLLVCHHFTIL